MVFTGYFIFSNNLSQKKTLPSKAAEIEVQSGSLGYNAIKFVCTNDNCDLKDCKLCGGSDCVHGYSSWGACCSAIGKPVGCTWGNCNKYGTNRSYRWKCVPR